MRLFFFPGKIKKKKIYYYNLHKVSSKIRIDGSVYKIPPKRNITHQLTSIYNLLRNK